MASPPLVATTRLPNERRFYTGMAITMLVVVFAGFARSFYLHAMFPEWHRPPESIFYIHGIVFTVWILLLVSQTALVMTGRRDVHRKIGVAGVVIAVLMVVLGTVAALVAARRPTGFVDVPVPPLQFLAIPLFALAQFALFAGLAIARRRDLQAHKRLMLLATMMLTGAAVARLPLVSNWGPLGYFGVTDLLLIPMIIWDIRTRGGLHPVTLWGGLLIIALEPLQLMISGTEGWIAFARWATGLLG